jgi:hypothetical protein
MDTIKLIRKLNSTLAEVEYKGATFYVYFEKDGAPRGKDKIYARTYNPRTRWINWTGENLRKLNHDQIEAVLIMLLEESYHKEGELK